MMHRLLPVVLALAPLSGFAAEETLFNRGWSFHRVETGADEPAGAATAGFDAGSWDHVTLPHTARIEPPKTSSAPFLGVVWYRRAVEARPEWKGKRVTLFFEGAMHVAEVWVNGEKVLTHEGGYTPFEVDLTAALEKTGKALVALRLDNTDKPLIPPGKPQAHVDFCYFGGLYRDVRLRVADRLHLTDAVASGKVAGGGVFARYEKVSEKSADVLLSAEVKNDGANSAKTAVRFSLVDTAGKTVATTEAVAGEIAPGKAASVSGKFTVESPRLWHPDDPYRYTLVTEVLRDGVPVDADRTKLGIRSLAFNDGGFFLNGKPYVLRGANRHQDFPWLGNAQPDNAAYRDLRLLKEGGFNFLRLAHYPQSQAVMDACDELGLMVSVCTPGWQYFKNDPVFTGHAKQNIRDMVRWHRNHPSVAMWEVTLNETYGKDSFFAECAAIAHEEYPGDQMLTSGDTFASKAAGYLDIPYPVWTDKGNIANPTAKVKRAFTREYGDYQYGGLYSTSRVPLGAGEDALLLQAWNHQWNHNFNRAQPWFGGDAVWAGVDDASSSGVNAKERWVSWWGPLDYQRLPKFSYHFYRSQQSPDTTPAGAGSGPETFIANYWTPRKGATKVVVYANGDEVELFLNGKSLGRRKPDSGPDTAYGVWAPDADPVYMAKGGDYASDAAMTAKKIAEHEATVRKAGGKKEKAMFDGGNARHIDRPPFTFPGVIYAPGELKAVSYRAGKPVSEFIRRTPGKPAALKIIAAEDGRPLAADGNDAMFFRALVVDSAGTVVPDNAPEVKFTVSGSGAVISTDTPTEAGIASCLVRAGDKPGIVTVTAVSPGLPSAKMEYTTR